MKKSMITKVGMILMLALVLGTNSVMAQKKNSKTAVLNQAKTLVASNKEIAKLLEKFDTLDFNVFSRRDWERFHESHSKDVIVHFPDGHIEQGLEQHIKTLDAMFVYAPDTRITEHPIRIGQGNVTAVMGWMTGTFTEPMPIGNGQYIQPTGKTFNLPMATIGIWKNGIMTEEYLFWDNKTYLDQMGLGK